MRCIRCHRPMLHATESGMGPICAKRFAKPMETAERDLFGYDVEKAARVAAQRLVVHIESMAADAHAAIRQAARAARVRMGVWAA